LIIGSELFDVLDEILPGGGFRTLYRLRPRSEPYIDPSHLNSP
jgi:hypothetical protein